LILLPNSPPPDCVEPPNKLLFGEEKSDVDVGFELPNTPPPVPVAVFPAPDDVALLPNRLLCVLVGALLPNRLLCVFVGP